MARRASISEEAVMPVIRVDVSAPFVLDYSCDRCGQHHALTLDHSGHFAGPLPCAPKNELHIQVEPTQWRRLVEEAQSGIVH